MQDTLIDREVWDDTEDDNIGHNSKDKDLRSICERIEALEEDKKAIADDIKDVKAEAKAKGYDTQMLNEVLKLRRMDAEKRREREETRDEYMNALDLI